MNALDIAAMFLVGLLGSGHCVAMCGGIAAALDVAAGSGSRAACRTGYQAGRLGGYMIAGALAGGLGATLLHAVPVARALAVSHGVQAAILVLLGLYLTGLWRTPLAAVERVGGRVWRWLGPVRRRLLPVRGLAGAFRMGLLWGFLPCGLVYSALAVSLAAGGAAQGALSMLAFGAGTVPAVVLTGVAGQGIARLAADSLVRRLAGVVILAGGLLLGRSALGA